MRILIVGAGGVGSAMVAIAHRRTFFEHLTVADVDQARAERAIAPFADPRLAAATVDASQASSVAALAREIKADARLTHLPLVLLTSMPQHAEAEQTVGHSFAACLTKPIRQARLLETIAGVLERSGRPSTRHLSLIRPRAQDGETGS